MADSEMQANEASVGTFIKELDGSEQNLMLQDGGKLQNDVNGVLSFKSIP